MKRLAWLGLTALALGCGSGSIETAKQSDAPVGGEVVLAEFNAEGAPTVDFSVPGMHCESCVAHVEGILAAQPGVKDVEVDLGSLTAKVAVDDKEFDGEQAVAALVDMQFDEAKVITADAAAAAKNAKPSGAGSDSTPTKEESAGAKEAAAKS
jgi:copper chaperone CopZ